ncbi:15877_t:CDS:2, partial [Racocetra persica]
PLNYNKPSESLDLGHQNHHKNVDVIIEELSLVNIVFVGVVVVGVVACMHCHL